MGTIEEFRETLAVWGRPTKISAPTEPALADYLRIRESVREALRTVPQIVPEPTAYETYVAPFRARDVAALDARRNAADPPRMVAKPRDELGRLARAQAERDRAARAVREEKERAMVERERKAWAKDDAARKRWAESSAKRALDRAEGGVEILLRSMAHGWLADGTTDCGAVTPQVSPLPQYLPRLRAMRNAWSCPDCRTVSGQR